MTDQSTAQDIRPPVGYVLRVAMFEDAQGVTDLINATDVAEGALAEESVEETLQRWNENGFDMAHGAWVVETADGLIVGYEECQDEHHDGTLWADGYVHPEHRGRGIGTVMMRLAEQRAREMMGTYPAETQIEMIVHSYSHDQSASEIFSAQGFHVIRHYWRMEIEMQDAPAVPVPPAGITIRTFVPERDERATHAAVVEAFLDHWQWVAPTFEDWVQSRVGAEWFDPSLWFIAIDQASGEIAGCSLGRIRGEDTGWVNSLGVRRTWRKQGLGMALLQYSFAEFYRRGLRRVGLGVDAGSLTGATRLYERAGMHVAQRYDRFVKVLRESTAKA